MPRTKVVIYRQEDGTVPMLDWLDGLPPKVIAKCRARIERLAALGHELRRPEADLLCDGIHELRIGFQGQNDRILYFFYKNVAAVLSHGLVKQRAVPAVEIDLAIRRRKRFEKDAKRHTHEES